MNGIFHFFFCFLGLSSRGSLSWGLLTRKLAHTFTRRTLPAIIGFSTDFRSTFSKAEMARNGGSRKDRIRSFTRLKTIKKKKLNISSYFSHYRWTVGSRLMFHTRM
jgi:hypothetical protein